MPQIFDSAGLVAPPYSHQEYPTTDTPSRPESAASLCHLPTSRSGEFILTPPCSPSNTMGNEPGLSRHSKESNASIDSKERFRRLRHTRKEQDRRKKNKAETDRLRGRVPNCDMQTSKVEVLARANDYINKLEEQLQEANKKIRDIEGRPPSAG